VTAILAIAMKSQDEYRKWFCTEGERLPAEIRREVRASLEYRTPREVFLRLNQLWESERLPEFWGPVLDDFYGLFC
jgi:hypothetical protein